MRLWILRDLVYHLVCSVWLLVWLSGNTLVSINVVTLVQAHLVPGWLTVFGRESHLGTGSATRVYLA